MQSLGQNASLAKKGLIDDFLKLLSEIADRMHSLGNELNLNDFLKSVKSEFKGITELTYKRLFKGVKKGFGGIEKETDQAIFDSLDKSVFVFSGFKTYKELKAVSELLLDKSGNIRNYNDFKTDVLSLNNSYNKAYLQSEYNNAVSSAQMSRIWKDAQDNKEDYDLMFDAVLDQRTRPAHAALDGIVKPVDDPFWDIYYPPLDWNCRCTVRLIPKGEKEISNTEQFNGQDIPEMFRNNVAKDGVIFPSTHEYYNVDKKTKTIINQIIKQ